MNKSINLDIASNLMINEKKYWENIINNEFLKTIMPFKHIKLDNRISDESVSFKIDRNLSEQLIKLCKNKDENIYLILCSVIVMLLHKYTENDYVTIEMPIYKQKEEKEVINTRVPLIIKCEENINFKQFVSNIREGINEAYKNSKYPITKIYEFAEYNNEEKSPLTDFILVFDNIHETKYLDEINDKVKLIFFREDENINLSIRYNNHFIDKYYIEKIYNHFSNLMMSIINNINISISDIDIISLEEKQQLLNSFNNTYTKYDKNKTIHQLFEEQVVKTPNSIAIVYNNRSLTYKELNEKANSLAYILRQKGVKNNNIVGLMIERSLEMVIGIMGILKSGAAYLPIDPQNPEDRLKHILDNSKSNILITTKELSDKLNFDIEVIDMLDGGIFGKNIDDLECINSSSDLAYVIYTSGSTGYPKGIMIEHRNVNNLICGLYKNIYSKYDKPLNIALVSPYYFDASIKQIFISLLRGHTLYIVPENIRLNGEKLLEYYQKNNIEVSDGTPVHINMIADEADVNSELELKHFIIGGDILTKTHVNNIRTKIKGVTITNVYGPTECCVDSTLYTFHDESINEEIISIGKPMSNYGIYITDKKGNLMPIGVAGELCVGGDGVARGYLNNSELTNEKFVNNPYKNEDRIYKTGDLARWLPDGNIEFLGRMDYQVKIRGYRIELGEIEKALLNIDGVKEAIVIAEKIDNNQNLTAYYVSKISYNEYELREMLKRSIPEYMIPTYFVNLKNIPVTKNGKIDRKALTEIEKNIDVKTIYQEPRNLIEEVLVKIWKEILGNEKIGINDDFFVLGGDSIKAIQLISRAKKYGYEFEVKDLFHNTNIKTLSKFVKKVKLDGNNETIKGDVILTPIQRRFFSRELKENHHWNQAIMLYCQDGFNQEIIQESFNKIISHHDALRMIYKFNKNNVRQINKGINNKLFDLFVYDFCSMDTQRYEEKILIKCNEIHKSIDLCNGPLVKLGLFKTNEGDHLLISIHHLIVDGISWRILLEDFEVCYQNMKEKRQVNLQDKTCSFKEWSEKLYEYSNSYRIQREIDYWKLIENTKTNMLPKNRHVLEKNSKNSKIVNLNLNKKDTIHLLKNVNKAYNTEINDILLSALALSIYEWTDDNKILINLEGHGRENIIKEIDISRTIGWFTTQYPVILEVNSDNELSKLIKNTKENLRRIPNKGIGYGVLKYLSNDEIKSNIKFNLNPEISFNYLGQFDQDLKSDIFSVSKLSSGTSMSFDEKNNISLDIIGMVVEGELKLTISYDNDEYEENVIENLAHNYKKNLLNLINHCINKDETEVTVSDITFEDISLEELEENKYKLNDIESIYSLTPMQEGIVFHSAMNKSSEAYHVQNAITLKGSIDVSMLQDSYNKLIEEYEILRTNFDYSSFKKTMQIVYKKKLGEFNYYDIRKIEKLDLQSYIENLILKDKKRGFNLKSDILYRIYLIRNKDDEYTIITSSHHVLMDGWSSNLLFNNLIRIYNSMKYGDKIEIKKSNPYSNYIKWLNNKNILEAEQYWKNYLLDYNEKISIPYENKYIDKEAYTKNEINLHIDKNITYKILDIAIRNKVTVNTFIQSIWALQLQKYNDTNDCVFGYTVSGRNADLDGIENTIGLFINTIPIRIKSNGNMKFTEILKSINLSFIDNSKYDYYPLANIQNLSNLKRNLLDHVMIFENYPIDKDSLGFKENFEIVNIKFEEQTNYDFNIVVFQNEDIIVKFAFNEEKYHYDDVIKIQKHFKNLITQILEDENMLLKDIELLEEIEKQVILEKFNDTKIAYESENVINKLFEEQVEKNPDEIAVIYENKSLTYRELNEKSNSLARILIEKGVKEETIVSIMVQPSLEMIISIIAVLKAGAAYLPIDSEYPVERIKYLLDDSGSKVLLSNKEIIENSSLDVKYINLSDDNLYNGDIQNIEVANNFKNLAYIIYTSGSTGRPKGVMIEHCSAINTLTNYINKYKIDKNKSLLLSINYVFDPSVEQIFGALLSGAKLCLINKEKLMNPTLFREYVNGHKINIVALTPTLANELIVKNEKMESIDSIICGGENLNYFIKSKILNMGYKLFNHYGPTETTIDALIFECDIKNIDKNIIGKPISNTQVYILDNNNNVVPTGVVGQIYISGHGVSRGYLNNKSLTSEKFIKNPYKESGILYKTGDLGKWTADGDVEYCGRIDNQIKIRGFRIELEEIEKQLLVHKEIKEVAVVDIQEDGKDKYLCAYIVSNKKVIQSEMREFLSNNMPEYMIPTYFIQLEKMPLNQNGKVDRKALPKPEESTIISAKYEGARNEVDEKLISAWKEVLGIKQVGINDNFFDLGGHSLKAMALIGRIHKELNVEITIKELFKLGNIKDISDYIESKEIKLYYKINKIKEAPYYEAASAQKRMYILNEIDKESIAYNMPTALSLEGELNVDRIKEAFKKIIERHESLRTSFDVEENVIIQKINEVKNIDINVKEIEEEDISNYISNFVKPFDLKQQSLIRIELLRVSKTRHILLVDMHHIISDGTSMSILTREFSELYSGKELKPLKIQYKDFSGWQNSFRGKEEFKKQEEFWLKEFEGEIPVLNLPIDYVRPITKRFKGNKINFKIDNKIVESLRQIAKQTGSTMYMILLSNLNILLSKYSGQRDIIVGSPIAGREHEDLKNIIGMFINTLPIRTEVNPELSYKQYLSEVKGKALRAYENQAYQFEEIVEKLNITRDTSRNPLFDVMFVFQNMDATELLMEGITLKSYQMDSQIEKFDITVTAVECEDEINITLSFDTDLFNIMTITRMKEHYLNIIKVTSNNAEISLKDIEIFGSEEKEMLLEKFNCTQTKYPVNKTIHQLFEEQVKNTPNNIALVFKDKCLTYKELNEKANSLALTLMDNKINEEFIVGIIAERSLEMVISIIAVLKAGGTYLPIDPQYPSNRVQYMLEDSNASILLIQNQFINKIDFSGKVIDINNEELYVNKQHKNLGISTSRKLAYVIYTSGTTGKPKGVMIEHRNILNTLCWRKQYYSFSEADTTLQIPSFSFDSSVEDIFTALISGVKLILIEQNKRLDLEYLKNIIIDNEVTHFLVTPSFYRAMLNEDLQNIKSLKKVTVAGENIKKEIIKEHFMKFNKTKLFNEYGPTENSVCSTVCELQENIDTVLIGKPISNTKVYILDKENKLAPIGVPGEICVSGAGIARGYINNKVLNLEKFIENPYEKNSRIYKTGDLGRWLSNGNIEFLGRIDNQVKINGFRIELEEIENSILKIDGISEVIVLDKETEQNNYLCAYYVGNKEYCVSELREQLKEIIPEYMIPSYFSRIYSIPLNANGKVDTKALYDLEINVNIGIEYEAPRNEVEEILTNIWKEMLGVDKVGINYDFFALGGDSIKAIQVISRFKKYGYTFEVKELFKNSNIKELSKHIKVDKSNISQKTVEGQVELAPIQKWFFDNKFKNEHHWNQAMMLYSKDGFDKELIKNTFKQIIIHHDALRMIYYRTDNGMQQINRGIEETLYDLYTYDLTHINDKYDLEITKLCNEIQESICLSEGPLVKLGLFKTNEGDHLLIVIHHLAVDGVSWRILLEDIAHIYESLKNNRKVELQKKTTSYKEWVQELVNYSNEYHIKKEVDYWANIESENVNRLPKDKATINLYRRDLRVEEISLNKDETQKLLKQVNHAYNTEINDILLASLAKTISLWTGDDKVLINLESHGRESIIENVDISRTVGWFTSQYPLLLQIDGNNHVAYIIKNVKETLRKVPNKGVGYGIIKYLSNEHIKSKIKFNLSPEIAFNYLGQFDNELKSNLINISNVNKGETLSLAGECFNCLDISGAIYNGKLKLSIFYNKHQYDQSTISKLTKNYKNNLIEMIEHCISKSEVEVTISDYIDSDLGDFDIGIEDIDNILDSLEI